MNRAEYINAVVPVAIERGCLAPAEGARILAATLMTMNRDDGAPYDDKDLNTIYDQVRRRYGWVMIEGHTPW